jgi:hypothetical protein
MHNHVGEGYTDLTCGSTDQTIEYKLRTLSHEVATRPAITYMDDFKDVNVGDDFIDNFGIRAFFMVYRGAH